MEQLMLKLAQNTNIKPKMKHYTLYIYIYVYNTRLHASSGKKKRTFNRNNLSNRYTTIVMNKFFNPVCWFQ